MTNKRGADNFGANMRRLMDANGLSYVSLSDVTGIPASSLHEYVLGKHRIPLANAFTIAQHFGRTIDEMLGA